MGLGCDAPTSTSATKPVPTTRSTPHAPDFALSADDRQALLDKAAQIRGGDKIARVKRLLGEPTVEGTMASKTVPPGPAHRILTYYITRYEANFVNEIHDESVTFWCDETTGTVISVDVRVKK
jgi:hypothetical protein